MSLFVGNNYILTVDDDVTLNFSDVTHIVQSSEWTEKNEID